MMHMTLLRSVYLKGTSLETGLFKYGLGLARASTMVTTEKAELLTAKPFEEMPAIRDLPLIGSSWIYMPIIGKFKFNKLHIADSAKYLTYGDVVREKFGSLDIVNCFTPETMEILFRHEGPHPSRPTLSALKFYRESKKEWYKSLGVATLQGQEWYDLRSKIQKHLMKPKAIQSYLEPMQDVARDMITLMKYKRDSRNEVPDFLGDLYKWALESVGFVGLDARLGCLNPHLPTDSDGSKMIQSVQTQFDTLINLEVMKIWKYVSTPTWRKFEKASDVFTEIAFKHINRSLDALKKADEDKEPTLLQSMLLTKGLDVSGAMVTVADMLLAGIDTTSHTVGFLLYNLAKNPDKQSILFDEIKQLLPNRESRITPDIFSKLHYLKACLKESIRTYPITRGNGRTFDHDVVISGYRVPAGTTVIVILQEAFRNEKYFKNANCFLPERWLNKENKQVNPFAYLPFGIGPRSCVGRRLAELEIISMTTEIIRNFQVEYHHEDMGMITRLVNTPDKPLRFTFIDR